MNMPEAKKRSAKRAMIPVIRIVNPFDPREFVRDELAWSRKKTLAGYFPLGTAEQSVVSINGKVIPQEQFGVTYLSRDDNIVICPIPAGGGGGKQILSLVALIAVSVMTAGAGAAIAGAMLGTDAIGFAAAYGAIGVGIANGLVTMAGSMLVGALFAPSQPKNTAASVASSSYGIDGAKNTSLEGIPVPVCYGEFRQGGNIIGLYTENDGDTQNLYMLLSAGEGPIAGISDILVNDNTIADYKDIETQIRLGTPDQDAIDWFNETSVAQNKGLKLTTDWTYHTTTSEVDKFRLDMVAPQGLCEIDTKTGESKNRTVEIRVQYRAVSAGAGAAWSDLSSETIQNWTNVNVSRNDQGYEWQYEDGARVTNLAQLEYLDNNPSGSRAPLYSGTLSMVSNKRSAVRKSFGSGKLATDKYEIRVCRTSAKSTEANILDDVYLSDVNEIQSEKLTYPNTALLALKIKLGDQISGMPTVTFVNGGRVVSVYGSPDAGTPERWYQSASKNPAWVVYDILTNRRFGGGMQSSRIDFHAFVSWAKYCEEQGLTWDGIIDTEMNVWDASQLVLRCGHAQLVPIGTRYTVVVERKSDPVMMFSVANMVEGSYKEVWLPTADRANEVDVTFYDRTDGYKERTVRIYDPASLTAGQKQKVSAITLYGVVDYDRAYREAQLQLNLNRYILKTASFSAPMEAIGCTVGDLVLLQSDMTDWATAGRFEAGSTTSVMKLDRDVTMAAGKSYKLLVLRDVVQRCAGAVTNVVGDSIFLSGFDGKSTVKRLKVNGMDVGVVDTFSQGAGFGVIVDDPTGITVGAPYTLHDTDVIEEYSAVTSAGTHSTITLQYPMNEAPSQFVNWMFGETEKVKKPFRVKSIGGSDYTREITAVEYNEAVYDFDRFDSTVTVGEVSAAIGPARELSVYEETYVAGESVVTTVYGTWRSPAAGIYAGADVYVQKNDSLMVKVGEVKSATSYPIAGLSKGDTVTVKVVAFDLFGKRSPFDQAPAATYKVTGQISNLDVGSVTGSGVTWAGRDCKLNWRYNATTSSYEFGSEPTGADAGSLDPHFKDYEISVFDADHATLRRVEHTLDPNYTYTFDKNYDDGLSRNLVFEVKMRDKFNNLGLPTVIEAHNPAPTVVSSTVVPTFESATISYTHSADPDFTGARIWVSSSAADLAVDSPDKQFLVYDGPDSSVVVPGLMFAADYFYKIAAYDAFGPTELIPTGVEAFKTTNLNVDAIADGVLDGSKLIPELQSRIDLIDAPGTGLIDKLVAEGTTRATAIAAEATARTKDIAAEALKRAQDLLAEATTRGAAITSVQQTIQDQNQSFASQVDTITAALGDNAAAIETERTTRVTALESVATQITTVAAKTDANIAAITQEQTARTDAVSALATTVSTVQAQTNANAAAIVSETTARTTRTDSLAQQITTVSAKTDANTASITNEVTARTNALESVATQLNQLDTAYKSADGATLVSANSYVQNYAYSKAGADAAIAATSSTLRTEFNAGDAATLTSANSFVQSYAYSKSAADSAIAASGTTLTTGYKTYADQARTDAITTAAADVRNYAYSKSDAVSAFAEQGSTLRAEFATADGATLTSAQGYVQNYAYSKADTNSAIASQVATVSARLDNVGGVTLEQKFIAQANATDGLSAQYTVKVDSNGYVSGFGLASTAVNGVPTSEFTINADKFAIVSSGGTDHPFTVGKVNGVTKTIIKSAVIGDASIGTLHIGDAQVNTLKITNNAVTALTSGFSGNVARGGFVSAAITTSGGPVMVIATSGGGLLIETLILQRDGMTLLQSDAAGSDYATGGISSTASYVDQPGAGYHTYYAYRQCESGGPSGRISLTVLETKR